jgi:hypothetical protein
LAWLGPYGNNVFGIAIDDDRRLLNTGDHESSRGSHERVLSPSDEDKKSELNWCSNPNSHARVSHQGKVIYQIFKAVKKKSWCAESAIVERRVLWEKKKSYYNGLYFKYEKFQNVSFYYYLRKKKKGEEKAVCV